MYVNAGDGAVAASAADDGVVDVVDAGARSDAFPMESGVGGGTEMARVHAHVHDSGAC